MDSGIPRKGFTNASLAATAATLVLSAGWITVAQGATKSLVRCDQEERHLTSLNVSREALSIDAIDHVTSESDPVSLEDLESRSDVNAANAPLLYLTPRVANLLRDVFQATGQEARSSATDDQPSSPVADSLGENESAERNDEIAQAISVDEETRREYHQQMYRKDI